MGLIHTTAKLPAVCYKLKRQVVLEFQSDIEGSTGMRRAWLRWKRAITLEIRYNQLLFLIQTGLRSGGEEVLVVTTRMGDQPLPTKKVVSYPL